MTQQPDPAPKRGNWADLRTRVISGIVLAVLGVLLLLSDGIWLLGGVSVLVALLMWELSRMTAAPGVDRNQRGLILAVVSGLVFFFGLWVTGKWPALLVLLPILLGWRDTAPAQRIPFVLFTLGFFGAGFGLYVMREGIGLGETLWIASIVVMSDIAGYFAGRWLGGPKFWPAISPKKTWSGTIAGWLGAILVTLIFMLAFRIDEWSILIAAPFIALAGQMGDIAESWLKRRVGVKDSSNMIPGHGGVMDRFDALAGAFLLIGLSFLLGI